MKIVIAEPLAAVALEHLQSQPGWEIVQSDPQQFRAHLADADALLVRSAARVTKEVLSGAPKLAVVGRAGVGVDNVDLNAATEAGVLVMNTPGGNAISVAEHTLALMLAMARSVPQASASTKSGRWEKKKFLGTELRGKTLGIVGLGSIGREVVRRAKAFEMHVVAHDPYVSPLSAADLGVTLVALGELYRQSDYISLHVALTPETDHLLGEAAFAEMKPGVRIVNCARGELIDSQALAAALQRGHVAGAALDVFDREPPAGDPLLQFDTLVATPHIAGSTEEAQEIVGVRIAQQLVEYLRHGIALNAVNLPTLTAEQYRALGPWADLAERLGQFAAHIVSGNPRAVRLTYKGDLAEANTHLLRNAGLAGVLSRSLEYRANVVNAMQIANTRGFEVVEQRDARRGLSEVIRLEIETDHGSSAVEGSMVLGKPRIILVDGIACEAPLAGNLMYAQNEDVPGVIGYLGTVLGRNGINVANFALGRQDSNGKEQRQRPVTAVSIVQTDEPVPDQVVDQLFENPAVKLVRRVRFTA